MEENPGNRREPEERDVHRDPERPDGERGHDRHDRHDRHGGHGRRDGRDRGDRHDRRDRHGRDASRDHGATDAPPRFRYDVVGVGYTAADFLGTVPAFPVPDTKIEFTRFLRQGGGPTATALVTLARLGASTCYIGKMGDDDLAAFMRAELDREGVDASRVVTVPGASSQLAICVVDERSGERTIFWTRGTLPELQPEEIERDRVTAGKFLLIDTHEPKVALQAAAWARAAGARVVMDASTPRPGTLEALAQVDFLVCATAFPGKVTGIPHPVDAARALLDRGPGVVVTTLGPGGAFAVRRNGPQVESPGFQVQAVDTTGAGDVFHGAFIFALLEGRELGPALEFANAAAAMKCRELGGRTGIPRREEVAAFLADPPPRHPTVLPQKWGRAIRVERRR